MQEYGDKSERKCSPRKSWRKQPLNEPFTPMAVRKTCVMSWPCPLLIFLLLLHEALLRKGQLSLCGAGHSQCLRTVWHTLVTLSLKHGHRVDFINFIAEITFSVGTQMSRVTFNKSEVFIYLHTRSMPWAAKAQTQQVRKRQERTHKTVWKTGTDIFGDFGHDQQNRLRGTFLAHVQLHIKRLLSSRAANSQQPARFGLFTTGLCPHSQRGLAFLPAGYLLFFKPTAGGSACGDGVFLSKSARFFFVLHSLQVVCSQNSHVPVRFVFHLLYSFTHKLKKK